MEVKAPGNAKEILHHEEISDAEVNSGREDKKISIALMASFVILTIQYFILVVFNLSGTTAASILALGSKGIVALAFIYALPVVFRRSKVLLVSAYFIAGFIVLLQYTFFVSNRNFILNIIFPLFFMSLPGFIYALSLRDFVVFKSVMKKAAMVVFAFGVLLALLIFSGRLSFRSYSMSLSYYLLLPTILFINDFLEKFSVSAFVFTVLSVIIMLALGSRGAILCVVVFASLKFFKKSEERSYARVAGHFSLMTMALFGFVFLEQIFMYIYHFLLRFGINSRSLLLFSREDLHLSGRDRLYDTLITEISKSPIVGIGIGGDRNVLNGSYAHNVLIEMIANFGVFLGIVLIGVLFWVIMKALLTKNLFDYSMVAMWYSFGFVHLMVSSSYIIDIKFWIFLGVMVNLTFVHFRRKVGWDESRRNYDF